MGPLIQSSMYQAQPLRKDGDGVKKLHPSPPPQKNPSPNNKTLTMQSSYLHSIQGQWTWNVKSKQQIRKREAATTSHGMFC